ncbi:MAG: hypothetical protein ABEI98_04970 [Halorhabdus sp.]
MAETNLSDEHRNVLTVLGENPRSRLREIHDKLVAMSDSQFVYSPEFGEGWNDERRRVRELIWNLNNQGLITNDYQQWYLTKEGRNILF